LDTLEQRCHDANAQKLVEAPNVCAAVAYFVHTMDGGMDIYDARWFNSNTSIEDDLATRFLNDPEVIKQLHVENNFKETKFSLGNDTVFENFIGDGMLQYIDEHQTLLENDITVLLFVGQFDRKDGPFGVQEWMKKLKWDKMDDFYAGSRNLYYYQSDDNNEIRLGGNFKQYENLNVLMIYAAGHLVPSTQLAASRSMLSDIIYHGGLQCHHPEGKCSLDKTT
jgi:carboxypeptidase C (cathepsin A)